MEEHAEKHKADDLIIVGKHKDNKHPRSPNLGLYQPVEHNRVEQKGRFEFNTDFELYAVEKPRGMKMVGGEIHCRTCRNFRLPFGKLNLSGRAKKARAMQSHEDQCRRAGKTEKGEGAAAEDPKGGAVQTVQGKLQFQAPH